MKQVVYDYNDRHLGETIYIIGCAPTLNDLSKEDLKFLEDSITIGVNLACEGVNSLTYGISNHISTSVYLFEYTKKDIPIFVDCNRNITHNAFAHMNFFWDDDKTVAFQACPTKIPLTKKVNKQDIRINSLDSAVLGATHLAYIMGAAKIVYIGFEELTFAHFWNGNKALEDKIQRNIRNILANKKYWSDSFYGDPALYAQLLPLPAVGYNVYKEFESMLGDLPGSQGYFNLSQEAIDAPFCSWGPWWNIHNLSLYRNYLNSIGIETYTLANKGVTIKVGCKKMETLRG